MKAPTRCALHPAPVLGRDRALNTSALFTVPPVSPRGGEFIWKFLWSTRPERCWRRDHFLMHSYILSLYCPSGTVVGLGSRDTRESTEQTEISVVRELTDLLVVTR